MNVSSSDPFLRLLKSVPNFAHMLKQAFATVFICIMIKAAFYFKKLNNSLFLVTIYFVESATRPNLMTPKDLYSCKL